MGLFGSSGSSFKWREIKQAPEQKEARSRIMDLIRETINFPTKQTAGLTDAEQLAQDYVAQYLKSPSSSPGLDTAIGEMTKTVGGGYDPLSSPYYEGYRRTSEMEEAEAMNALKRRTQLVGMSRSTPELTQMGKTARGYSADRMTQLGGLYESERNRQTGMAGTLASAEEYRLQEPVRRAQAGATFGAIPREIENERLANEYSALLQTLLAPYTYQAPLAAQVMTEPRYVGVQSSGGGTDWGKIIGQAAGTVLGGINWGSFGGSSGSGSPSGFMGNPYTS